MAKKPISGARWFEAIGRRAKSKGMPLLAGRIDRIKWPMLARRAWVCGRLDQGSVRAQAQKEKQQ